MGDDASLLNFHFELSGPTHQLLNLIRSLPTLQCQTHLLNPLLTLLQTNNEAKEHHPSSSFTLDKNLIFSALEAISELLLFPELTLEIMALFRPCLIDLCARCIHSIKKEPGLTRCPSPSESKRKITLLGTELDTSISTNEPSPTELDSPGFTLDCSSDSNVLSLTSHDRVSIALSKVVLAAPQVISMVTSYYSNHPSPLDRFLTVHTPSTFCLPHFKELLLATYRLISVIEDLKKVFPLHLLIPFLDHPSLTSEPDTHSLLAHLLSTTYGLSDNDTSILMDPQRSSLNSNSSLPDSAHEHPTNLVFLEHKAFLRSLHQQITTTPCPKPEHPIYISASDLSPYVENICGILIPKDPSEWSSGTTSTTTFSASTPPLIDTPTTLTNLHALALAVSLGSPVLLEGVSGAGKTSLIEDLARRLRLPPTKVVKIHLGDQLDGKTLLGSYMATHQPGEFVWARGVLTKAVEEGCWVVFEDLNLVSPDILSLLIPLLEARTLFISQRGQQLRAHPRFHFFATCALDPVTAAVAHGGAAANVSLFTSSFFTRVHVHALPHHEVVPVLQHRFPVLHAVAEQLVTTHEAIARCSLDPCARSAVGYTLRTVSTRDLVKWCDRIQHRLLALAFTNDPGVLEKEKESIMEIAFVEAMDVFVQLVPNSEYKDKLVHLLQSHLHLSQARVEFYRFHYAPDIHSHAGTHWVCGRATLPISSAIVTKSPPLFTYTAHTKKLLEQVSTCVVMNEPVLLIGETGTGKTSLVQHLAHQLHKQLHVVNLSQQSDSSDWIGGFKPITLSKQLENLIETFLTLFAATFSVKKNASFLSLVQTARERQKVDALFHLFQQAIQLAHARFEKRGSVKQAMESNPKEKLAWNEFATQVDHCRQLYAMDKKKSVVFQFVEGVLVSSLRKGDWILLDEVNLASPETLESLSGLLEKQGSLVVTERGGDNDTVVAKHPEFRLFACMNPSTDIGKKDLPMGLRTRFTELYVHSPDTELSDLKLLIASYLSNCLHTDPTCVQAVLEFYMQAKQSAASELYDGAGFRPHFTLRTLTRALTFAASMVSRFGVRRALYEGLSLTFLTLLDVNSQQTLIALLHRCLFQNRASQYLNVPVNPPSNAAEYVRLDAYWLKKGPLAYTSHPSPSQMKPYILSPTVKRNFIHLVRSVMTMSYPVLIQGPTSSGKTSMIEYLAHVTGHTFVRVNNHAHTDLQEYLGCYVSNDQGQLVFKEGTLVTALRQGHWIVLDELNLAPTDVLEALNRLLDDNRELFLPETQTWIHPHPSFMLFATQNPPSYGGRKLLSRAFRNRFLELHFDDLPDTELLQILSQRCSLPSSFAKKMVLVYQTLRSRRQTSRIFDGKASFITLRDLFRWADRQPASYEELAMHGFMILGERVRNLEEKQVILDVLNEVFKVQVNPATYYATLYKAHAHRLPSHIVWNESMQRLFALTYTCQQHGEPVLLVGETGCGKTTVCQVIAELNGKPLTMVNCHQYSETSDFLGSQRPCRHHGGTNEKEAALFEWQDGPLVLAMKQGHDFLLDEISLADDSVLERLNSLLEPGRSLLLAEKGGDAEHVVAHTNFRFFATMNPGGDYGKKELSPALRNRFTEIWTPPITGYQDRWSILHAHLSIDSQSSNDVDASLDSGHAQPSEFASLLATRILDFIVWYELECERRHAPTWVSIRDLIAWCQFITATYPKLSENEAFYHGACLVLLDGLKNKSLRDHVIEELLRRTDFSGLPSLEAIPILNNETQFGIEPFVLCKSTASSFTLKHSFHAPTAKLNLYRLLRALFATNKAILLEGSPGVGKTSVVSSLAAVSGHALVRINLSEQTDLVDLFGSDLPIEGGAAGAFAWRDGLFLSAMKRGEWVLLDELNLASQSVLEGLNACLDHRGTVYIPELNQSFTKHPKFRIFAAQNPMEEGGGRRGLPKSFLNRFISIHLEPLSSMDYAFILKAMFPEINVTDEEIREMIQFNALMHEKTMVERTFGVMGAPWEFNLRDLIRWLELKSKYPSCSISSFLDLIYFHRLQTKQDVESAMQLWFEVSKQTQILRPSLDLVVTPHLVQLGLVNYPRNNKESHLLPLREVFVPNSMLSPLHSLLQCLEMGWMAMINGPSASGKTYLARTAASLCGKSLIEFSVHKSVDAMELLGGFEQMDANRCWEDLVRQLTQSTWSLLPIMLRLGTLPKAAQTLASFTSRSFPLGSISLVEAWIMQLHQIAEHFNVHDPHALHLHLLNKYRTVQLHVAGKFEWVDGIVLEAIQTGKWLLLENANLCSPSVLDRLNPLFESTFNRRQLVINERGMTGNGDFVVVEPHPDFRLIMTMNPIHGHISRALRNRGIEISLFHGQWIESEEMVRHVMELNGIVHSEVQNRILNKLISSGSSSPRHLLLSIAYAADLLQRGFPIDLVLPHRLLNDSSLNSSLPPISLFAENKNRLHSSISPHFPLNLQHSVTTLMATKFSFIEADDALFKKPFLQPSLDWILFHSSTYTFYSNFIAWLDWRNTRSPSPRFSIEKLKRLFLKMRTFVSKDSFSNPLAVKSLVEYTRFILNQEETLSSVEILHPDSLNCIQRSFSTSLYPNRILIPTVTETESLLYPLFTALNKCITQNLLQPFEQRTLDILTWTESLWYKCLLTAPLNLDLLDAHVSQLLKLTEQSVIYIPYRKALLKLQASYFGDMDIIRLVWSRFHPWVVRSHSLFESVLQLESLQLNQVAPSLLELISDALVNVYLGDLEHQASLELDFPRLLKLVNSNGLISTETQIENSKLMSSQNSLTILIKQFDLASASRSNKSKLWLWAIQLFEHLPQFLATRNASLSLPSFLFTNSPTIKGFVSMRLMQWSIQHQNSLERSWNQIYFEFQKIISDHSLWKTFPKELSVELCERSKNESILGLESLQKQISNLISLFMEHSSYIEVNLFAREKSLLQARLQLLSNFPIPLKVKEHIAQVEFSLQHHTNLAALSEAWMNMGLVFVKLATPTLPLDPASRFKLTHENALQWQSKLNAELDAFNFLQYRDNGMHENEITIWLTQKLPEIQKLILESGRQLYLRPENAAFQLQNLFSYLRNLFSSLFNPKTILQSYANMKSKKSFQEQLNVIRQSFSSFVENTKLQFPYFMDMLEPIYTGIYDILHGFSLLGVCDQNQSFNSQQAALECLPWLKPGSFYNLIDRNEEESSEEKTIDLYTCILEMIAIYQHSNPCFKLDPSLLIKLLKPLIAQFSLVKEKEALEREESSKSFKYASFSLHIADDDSDSEWKDVDNDTAHLKSLEQASSNLDNEASVCTGLKENSTELNSVVETDKSTVSKKKLSSWITRSFYAFQMIHGHLKFDKFVKVAAFQTASPKFSNSALHHLLSLINSSNTFSEDVNPSTYDFYRHSNLPEVFRLVPILTKLDSKTNALLEEWPEHDTLQQIKAVVCRMSTFSSQLPLKKYLESLEFLVGKCDEWEKYASSSVSLKESIHEISSIIVDWRKLEVSNWKSLLDWYDQEQIKEGASLWLHLLSLLAFVDGITESELISSLDEFFMGSSLGQFEFRIQILSSLSKHFDIPIIFNVIHYYSEFLPFVRNALKNGRTLIESELKSFVKIAGWRDVNIYSLKLSAQKNRKQLGKCLKKYRALLGRPLAPMLKEKNTFYFGEQRTEFKEKAISSLSTLSFYDYPVYLLDLFKKNNSGWMESRDVRLNRILTKSMTLTTKCITLPTILETLTSDVIEQIVAFKSETDAITEPISKQESSFLLQCRKKAFSDLLKTFKEMGLMWHQSVPVELSTLMTSPNFPLSSSFSFSSLLSSSNTYCFRIASYLPFIYLNSSPDLQPKQAERLLGYVMDLFKHTIAERSYLGPVCKHLLYLQSLIQAWTFLGKLSTIPKEWVGCKHFFSFQIDLSSLLAYNQQLLKQNTVSMEAKRVLELLNSKLSDVFELWNKSIFIHSSIQNFDRKLFETWEKEKEKVIHEIQNIMATSPRDILFMRPILETLSQPVHGLPQALEMDLDSTFFEGLNRFIEKLMIQIQHLYAFNEMDPSVSFKPLHSDILSLLSKLDLSFVELFSESCFSKLSPELQYHLCKRLLPLLQSYVNYLHSTLHEIFVHHKSLSKCTYVLCINAFKLVERGYCVPTSSEENQEKDATADSGQELEGAEGTGIGQGEGSKDVSNEIENEGQIEGLMGEEEYQSDKPKENKNDEGVEMEQDFQGKLEDLNLDGEERDQDQRDGSDFDSEEEGGREKMDMMNEVDNPDSHEVDPTLWDDESDDEKEMREAEDIEHSTVQRNPHEVETLEETQQLQEEPKSKDMESSNNMEGHAEEKQSNESEATTENLEKTIENESNEEEKVEAGDDKDMETSSPDKDTGPKDEESIKTPENMESEIGLEEMGDTPLDFAESVTAQDELNKDEDNMDDDNNDVDMDANASIADGSDNGMEVIPEDEPEEKSGDDEDEKKEPESSHIDANMKQDDVYGTETMDVNGVEVPLEKDAIEKEDENTQTDTPPTIAGHSNINEGNDDAIDQTTEMADHQGPSQKHVNASKNLNSSAEPPESAEIVDKPSDIAPSLAENIEAWKRKLKIAEETLLKEKVESTIESPDNHELQKTEYTHLQDDDQEMEGDEQMLAAVEPNLTSDMPFPLDKEIEEKEPIPQEPTIVPPGLGAQEKLPEVTMNTDNPLNHEDEIKVQVFGRPSLQEPLLLEEEQEYRKKLLDQVDIWREQGRDLASSMTLWHGCKNLTLLYATQLTEQLRLLLEPTLASHLTGDYKTGKRLNMRRVLSYIASDFRKDKIWLRRTKPNQRDYQVLIAVDDSQSMNDSSAIQLAFESVCLITRAMEQLEVGPIALCSFGEDLKVLHPFGQRFTDDAGIHAFQSFRFNQPHTNIEALLHSSLHLFEETHSQTIPWRLMLILSDGLCDHHTKLRHLVRKAAEARILTVCIVLDQREESILQMSSVNFENGQLRMTQYMDDFPFDFYVVLRDIRRLPMVLSDALRQFFTLSTST